MHNEVEYLRRYLKKTFEGFSVSLMHGGSIFVRQAMINAGASRSLASRLVHESLERKGGGGRARGQRASGGGAAEGIGLEKEKNVEMQHSPMFLIQQISVLRQQRLNAGTGTGAATEITSMKVALARSGQLKATFQRRSFLELRRAGIVARFDDPVNPELWTAADDGTEGMSAVTMDKDKNPGDKEDGDDMERDGTEEQGDAGDPSENAKKNGKNAKKKKKKRAGGGGGGGGGDEGVAANKVNAKAHAGFSYLFSGDKMEKDVFTVTVSTGQNVVESFCISVEHLKHLHRTMTVMHCAQGSRTWFYVETMLEMLEGMTQHERVLNLGS